MPDIGQHDPAPHDLPEGGVDGGDGDEGREGPDDWQSADTEGAPLAITVDPKIANGWLHTAKFLTTAPTLQFLPRSELPEIAFVGRSNVGKSSCINTLTQQHRLAFASKTPGRTQAINLFTLGKQGIHDAVLADLPGYGYAKVPLADKHRWQKVMANYLVSRDNLTAVVLLCDPRHGLTELDDLLLDILRPRVQEGLKLLVILTKADKLNRTESAKALSIMRLQVAGAEVRMFSSSKKTGVDEVAQLLWHWAHPVANSNTAGETLGIAVEPSSNADQGK
jgi:GTP-binding protein